MRFAIFAVFMVVLGSCKPGDPQVNEEDVPRYEALARTLPLGERYALYRRVYDSDLPPMDDLADEVAELGSTAMQFVVAKAKSGDVTDISSSIPVISAYTRMAGTPCSADDIKDIQRNIRNAFVHEETASIVSRRLHAACGPPELD